MFIESKSCACHEVYQDDFPGHQQIHQVKILNNEEEVGVGVEFCRDRVNLILETLENIIETNKCIFPERYYKDI